MVTIGLLLLGALDGGAPPTLSLDTGTPVGERCTVAAVSSRGGGLRWGWRLDCGLDWVQQSAIDSSGAIAFGNYDFAPIFRADARGLTVVDAKAMPDALVSRVRGAMVKQLPPGYEPMARDRAGSWLALHDGRLIRMTPNGGGPYGYEFESVSPPLSGQGVRAVLFDADMSLTQPWAVAERWEKGDLVHLEVISPDGGVERLATRPVTHSENTHSSCVVSPSPAGHAPVVSWLSNTSEHTLFVPGSDGYRTSTFFQPPRWLPDAGVPTRPDALTRRCSEQIEVHHSEVRRAPTFFTDTSRLFLAMGVQVTDARFRFGLVPKGGATPDDDGLSCGWIEDARVANSFVTVSEVRSDATLDERLRIAFPARVDQVVMKTEKNHRVLIVKAGGFWVLSLDREL